MFTIILENFSFLKILQMKRKTRTSLNAETARKKQMKVSKDAALLSICEDMWKVSEQNNGKLPYGHVSEVLATFLPLYPWLTRDIINCRYIRFKKKKTNPLVGVELSLPNPEEETIVSQLESNTDPETVTTCSTNRTKGGRPVGTSRSAKMRIEKEYQEAKNEISKEYKAAKDMVMIIGKNWKKVF